MDDDNIIIGHQALMPWEVDAINEIRNNTHKPTVNNKNKYKQILDSEVDIDILRASVVAKILPTLFGEDIYDKQVFVKEQLKRWFGLPYKSIREIEELDVESELQKVVSKISGGDIKVRQGQILGKFKLKQVASGNGEILTEESNNEYFSFGTELTHQFSLESIIINNKQGCDSNALDKYINTFTDKFNKDLWWHEWIDDKEIKQFSTDWLCILNCLMSRQLFLEAFNKAIRVEIKIMLRNVDAFYAGMNKPGGVINGVIPMFTTNRNTYKDLCKLKLVKGSSIKTKTPKKNLDLINRFIINNQAYLNQKFIEIVDELYDKQKTIQPVDKLDPIYKRYGIGGRNGAGGGGMIGNPRLRAMIEGMTIVNN